MIYPMRVERPARSGEDFMPETGSTLPRRQLGRYLTEWRSRAGMSQQKAAELLEMGSSSLQRLERGQNSRIKVRDIQAACDLYGVPSELAEALTGLARQASVKSWWHEYGDLIPKDFDVYVGLETAAVELRSYHPELIPGLFQTPDYLRALAELCLPDADAAEHDRWIQLRMQRQNIVTRKTGPTAVNALIGEAALHRISGSRRIMAAQLKWLADISTRPNVTIRVLPFRAGFPGGAYIGPFVILDFGTTATGEPVEPTVVFIEGSSVGNLYLEKPDDVRRYDESYEGIRQAALDATASRNLFRQVAREYLA
ncbi:helix-turn-helix domain-containing protein [Nocardia suismassiliense]|uniref:helix-turn-helix domain-containing protein n=1 Tax=Nocardia suismassiliense TaxID=2077092 RepID=UPI002D7834D3|nr:helix-turn-helix transcriptional regulator [Nocardia suismassiliense]